jgi:hypothetical protein
MRRTHPPLPSILVSRTDALARLSVGMACLLRAPAALAVCDNLASVSGETATCSANAPNPSTTPVVAGAGVSVNNSSDIAVRDSSTAQNFGSLQITADLFDGITSEGSTTGFGYDILSNGGSIHTACAQSEGMLNGSAAVTMVHSADSVIGTSGTGSAAMLDLSAARGGTLRNTREASTCRLLL